MDIWQVAIPRWPSLVASRWGKNKRWSGEARHGGGIWYGCFHCTGENPVTWPHLTWREAGKGSLTVCLARRWNASWWILTDFAPVVRQRSFGLRNVRVQISGLQLPGQGIVRWSRGLDILRENTSKNLLHWTGHEIYLLHAPVTGYVHVASAPDSGKVSSLKTRGNCFSYLPQMNKRYGKFQGGSCLFQKTKNCSDSFKLFSSPYYKNSHPLVAH